MQAHIKIKLRFALAAAEGTARLAKNLRYTTTSKLVGDLQNLCNAMKDTKAQSFLHEHEDDVSRKTAGLVRVVTNCEWNIAGYAAGILESPMEDLLEGIDELSARADTLLAALSETVASYQVTASDGRIPLVSLYYSDQSGNRLPLSQTGGICSIHTGETDPIMLAKAKTMNTCQWIDGLAEEGWHHTALNALLGIMERDQIPGVIALKGDQELVAATPEGLAAQARDVLGALQITTDEFRSGPMYKLLEELGRRSFDCEKEKIILET